jgi:transcription antitermination factor NusG
VTTATQAAGFGKGQKVTIAKGPHAGRTAEVTEVKGPKTVELAVLDADGRQSFLLWNVKKANLVKAGG